MDREKFSRQIKMARALLGWTVRELAEKAGVSPDSVSQAESASSTLSRPILGALQNALENEGIEFFENGTVVQHDCSEMSDAGVAASPSMPLQARRIYPR